MLSAITFHNNILWMMFVLTFAS